MKNPHDTNEYQAADEVKNIAEEPAAAEEPPAPNDEQKPKKQKFSGAYYFVDVDEVKLSKAAFVRTLLTIGAILLQFIILILPPSQLSPDSPQTSVDYICDNYATLALFYVMFVIAYVVIAVWLVVMNMTKYKFMKRIPKEYAPKNGFKNRAFFGAELFIAANALITVFEIVFVSLCYDPITLVAVFISALALAAAVGARQITYLTLRNSQFVPALQDN